LVAFWYKPNGLKEEDVAIGTLAKLYSCLIPDDLLGAINDSSYYHLLDTQAGRGFESPPLVTLRTE
jgi:hypothetical protein